MKNNKVLYAIIGIVALFMVDLIIFLCVKEYTIARWINIAGINLSIIILWGAGIITSEKSENFLEYSRFPVVATYSGITFIISAILIIIGVKNINFSIIIQVLLLGIFVIVMATNTMANNASINDSKVDKTNYNKIADMSKRIDMIMQMVDDRDIYKKIEKTYDAVKNAKITVVSDSSQIDNDIMQEIGILNNNVQNKNFTEIDEQLNKINNLIITRNQM